MTLRPSRRVAVAVCATACLTASFIATDADAGIYLRGNFNDHVKLAKQDVYKPVVRIKSTGGFCSSTVIRRRWVLTAAHCLDSGSRNVQVLVNGKRVAAESWYLPDSWNGRQYGQGGDLALVRLAEPVTGITPATFNRRGTPVGEEVTIVGWGSYGNGAQGNINFDFRTKLAGNNRIDRFFSAQSGAREVMQYDMDAGDLAPVGYINKRPKKPKDYPIDLEFSAASGDSGGGVFQDGELIGVTSFGSTTDSRFGSVEGAVFLNGDNKQWIRDVLRSYRNGDDFANTQVGSNDSPIDVGVGPLSHMSNKYAHSLALTTVPEPGTLSLLLAGGVYGLVRRRRSA